MVSSEPFFFLQAEEPQLSQPFLTGEVFHPSDCFCDCFLGPAPIGSYLSHAGDSPVGHSTPGGVSQWQAREAESPPLTYWHQRLNYFLLQKNAL